MYKLESVASRTLVPLFRIDAAPVTYPVPGLRGASHTLIKLADPLAGVARNGGERVLAHASWIYVL